MFWKCKKNETASLNLRSFTALNGTFQAMLQRKGNNHRFWKDDSCGYIEDSFWGRKGLNSREPGGKKFLCWKGFQKAIKEEGQ